MSLRRALFLLVTATGLAGAGMASAAAATVPVVPTVALSHLDGATTPVAFTLDVDVPAALSAKLFVDGAYVARDSVAPLQFPVTVAAGRHDVMVRVEVGSGDTRTEATFTASGSTTATTAPTLPTTAKPTTTTAPPATTSTTAKPTTTTTTAKPTTTTAPPVTVPPGGGGDSQEVQVHTADELRAAVAAATPGTVIDLADGEYQFKPRLNLANSGTASAPITLRGSRNAVVRTKNASGDYGLWITGDHWRIQGITVAHASKGIVLDGSVGSVIDGVEVYDIGDEGVHFRSCSSDGVLRNSYVHDTGRTSAQYGEGVYVGSANSNWSLYQCTDAKEGVALGDNTERVVVEGNTFENVTAEGADLKEGTDSGTLVGNTFIRAGNSGQNSADSAVDAKGNNWLIQGNSVSDEMSPWSDKGVMEPSEFLDGFQSHNVYAGYGTGNVFVENQVAGAIPGFGVGLNPALGNVVYCDNSAPGAARGLVGDKNQPSTCTPG